jgi:hypothetical protein
MLTRDFFSSTLLPLQLCSLFFEPRPLITLLLFAATLSAKLASLLRSLLLFALSSVGIFTTNPDAKFKSTCTHQPIISLLLGPFKETSAAIVSVSQHCLCPPPSQTGVPVKSIIVLSFHSGSSTV